MPFISTDSVKNSPCQLCYTALVSRSIFWRLAMSCRIWGHKIISCSSLPLALEMFTTWLETVFRRRMRRTRTSRRWRILQISSTARNLFKRKGHTTSDYIYNMALEPLIPPIGTWWLSRWCNLLVSGSIPAPLSSESTLRGVGSFPTVSFCMKMAV